MSLASELTLATETEEEIDLEKGSIKPAETFTREAGRKYRAGIAGALGREARRAIRPELPPTKADLGALRAYIRRACPESVRLCDREAVEMIALKIASVPSPHEVEMMQYLQSQEFEAINATASPGSTGFCARTMDGVRGMLGMSGRADQVPEQYREAATRAAQGGW
jgi:hypothetical protein